MGFGMGWDCEFGSWVFNWIAVDDLERKREREDLGGRERWDKVGWKCVRRRDIRFRFSLPNSEAEQYNIAGTKNLRNPQLLNILNYGSSLNRAKVG